MTLGTRTLLFGVHQIAIHPFFVWIACLKTWGWRDAVDPRVLFVILVHDWGYLGCAEIDGEQGKWHPVLGAWLVSAILDRRAERTYEISTAYLPEVQRRLMRRQARVRIGPWGRLCLLHSRSVAKRLGKKVSPLCGPDKLSSALYPRWLYLALAKASGEIEEYLRHADTPGGRAAGIDASSPVAWFISMQAYMRRVANDIEAGRPVGVAAEDERRSA